MYKRQPINPPVAPRMVGRQHPRRQAAALAGYRPVVRPRRVVMGAGLQRQLQQQQAEAAPPGNPINANVINWYYQNAFEVQLEEDDMSKKYPWLFGEGGLYNMKCRYPCYMDNGACVCPE